MKPNGTSDARNSCYNRSLVTGYWRSAKQEEKLEYYLIAVIFAATDLILLLLFLAAASHVDKSKVKGEQPRGTQFGTSSDKFRQEEKSDLEKLTEGIARLEQQLKPMLDLTIKHERRLSGIQSKGALGEQIVGEKLGDLPHDWYDHNVPFPNGAKADFAIRTPDKRWIPIDSQWTATELLDRLEQAKDQTDRNSLRIQVHDAVRNHATAAKKYLDPHTTLGFGIVAVPNSVFELCIDMQAELVSENIVLISHSLLVPYILLLFNLYLQDIPSTQRLEISHILNRSAAQIELIKKYINSRVRPSIASAKLQQNQYGLHSLMLHDIYSRLDQLQGDFDGVRKMVSPPLDKEIGLIPNMLQSSLTKVQADLLEGLERLNGDKPDTASENK
jgi:hypothetical protein